MAYSEKIKDCIQNYFEKNDWYYILHSDEEVTYFKAGIKLDSKLRRCDIIVDIRDDYYLSYAKIALGADENSMVAVSEYLHRVNFGLKLGCFELDPSDGEIRYKMYVDCGDDCDCMPTESVICRSIELPASMVEKYGDGLMQVLLGQATPEEASEAAEYEDEVQEE